MIYFLIFTGLIHILTIALIVYVIVLLRRSSNRLLQVRGLLISSLDMSIQDPVEKQEIADKIANEDPGMIDDLIDEQKKIDIEQKRQAEINEYSV